LNKHRYDTVRDFHKTTQNSRTTKTGKSHTKTKGGQAELEWVMKYAVQKRKRDEGLHCYDSNNKLNL